MNDKEALTYGQQEKGDEISNRPRKNRTSSFLMRILKAAMDVRKSALSISPIPPRMSGSSLARNREVHDMHGKKTALRA